VLFYVIGVFLCVVSHCRQLLRPGGQSFWLQIQRSRVRFSGLPHFLRSSGSKTGSTLPREYNYRVNGVICVAEK
jgi:hypothetical protein